MNDRLQQDTGDAARSRFEHAVESLPAATANRLRLARRAALAGKAPAGAARRWAVPLGAAAALLLGIAWWRQVPVAEPAATVADSAVAQAAASGTMSDSKAVSAVVDLPSEDEADLYAWMADTPVANDARGSAL